MGNGKGGQRTAATEAGGMIAAIILAMQRQELRKIAEGREAEMYAWGDGTILRLLRSAVDEGKLQREALAMEAARSSGVRVPAVHDLTMVNGRPGMVMERIDGPDLLALVARRPWKMFWGARILGEVHAQLHAARGSSRLPELRVALRRHIESANLPEHQTRFAIGHLDGLPDGEVLCHGDFHPGNIIVSDEGPVVIDWTGATRGDADADLARSLLMFRIGELPPGSRAVLRALATFARKMMASAYLRAYRRQRPLEMATVERWDIPVTAGRVADGIEEETPRLLALLEEEYGRTG